MFQVSDTESDVNGFHMFVVRARLPPKSKLFGVFFSFGLHYFSVKRSKDGCLVRLNANPTKVLKLDDKHYITTHKLSSIGNRVFCMHAVCHPVLTYLYIFSSLELLWSLTF
jgi:hypothetical protein